MRTRENKRVVLVTPPTEDVLSYADVKAHLRIDCDDEKTLVESMIAAAVGGIDPAAGGWLGRALRPQTWELQLDGFPLREDRVHARAPTIELDYPPLITIVTVKYDDPAGVERSLSENVDYTIFGVGGRHRSFLAPVFGNQWPTARCAPASVRIRYTCGYPTGETDSLPAPIKAWLKLKIGTLYQNREQVTPSGAQLVSLPDHIEQMISTQRVY